MTDQPVVLKRENGVVVLTLNNPSLNVTTLETTRALDALVSQLADDPTVRVTVLTGSGERAFCAGSDIKEFPAVADAVIEKKLGRENAVFSRIAESPSRRSPLSTGSRSAAGSSLRCAATSSWPRRARGLRSPRSSSAFFPAAAAPSGSRVGSGKA